VPRWHFSNILLPLEASPSGLFLVEGLVCVHHTIFLPFFWSAIFFAWHPSLISKISSRIRPVFIRRHSHPFTAVPFGWTSLAPVLKVPHDDRTFPDVMSLLSASDFEAASPPHFLCLELVTMFAKILIRRIFHARVFPADLPRRNLSPPPLTLPNISSSKMPQFFSKPKISSPQESGFPAPPL